MGIQRRISRMRVNYDGKGFVDHEAFSAITAGSCYFAGLLYGDGNVSLRKYGQDVVMLYSNDDYLANEFSKFTCGSVKRVRPGLDKNGKIKFTVSVASNQLARDLEKFGVLPGKSSLDGYELLEMGEFFWDYIRGVLDSDGTIGIYKRKCKPTVNICLFGTRKFTEVIAGKLGLEGVESTCHWYNCTGVSTLRVRDRSLIRFINKVYGSEDSVALPRKYNRAINVMKLKLNENFLD